MFDHNNSWSLTQGDVLFLQSLMTDETIGNVPILILGNKIDRPEAISEEKMREMFGLYGQTTGKVSRGRYSAGTELQLPSSTY